MDVTMPTTKKKQPLPDPVNVEGKGQVKGIEHPR